MRKPGDELGARRSSVFPAPVRDRSSPPPPMRKRAPSHGRPAARRSPSSSSTSSPRSARSTRSITPLRQRRLVRDVSRAEPDAVARCADDVPQVARVTGATERMRVLAAVFGEDVIEQHIRRPPRGAGVDDVLDAFAGAWTARRFVARRSTSTSAATGTPVACGWRWWPDVVRRPRTPARATFPRTHGGRTVLTDQKTEPEGPEPHVPRPGRPRPGSRVRQARRQDGRRPRALAPSASGGRPRASRHGHARPCSSSRHWPAWRTPGA